MKNTLMLGKYRWLMLSAAMLATGTLAGCDLIQKLKDKGEETKAEPTTTAKVVEPPPPIETSVATGEVAAATSFAVGDKVQVKWQGAWYPAVVKTVKNDKYYIHYTGWSSRWDEWVGSDRIRDAKAGEVAARYQAGDKVMVLWKGRWYAGTILAVTENGYRVHYDGWASSWDEWVSPARVKPR